MLLKISCIEEMGHQLILCIQFPHLGIQLNVDLKYLKKMCLTKHVQNLSLLIAPKHSSEAGIYQY